MGYEISLPEASVKTAILVSLLSVWVLVGLFQYLNRYTRRHYFTIWTAGWLFYALFLTISITLEGVSSNPLLLMAKNWCIATAAVLMFWGSFQFLNFPASQRLITMMILFITIWSYSASYQFPGELWIHLPAFALLACASGFTAYCFFFQRSRVPYLGAGLLTFGFALWAVYLLCYPFLQAPAQLLSVGFLISGVLQLFIAISMIVLVMEEVRANMQRAEQQLRQAEKLSALGQMISGVAHELNNPLAAIKGYTDLLLLTAELDQPTRSALIKVAQESNRASKLVHNFLAFARPETPELENLKLNTVVGATLELRRKDLALAGIELACSFTDANPSVLVNSDQIGQVIANLLSNATDALRTWEGPRLIGVVTRVLDRKVQIRVEDNGPGISDEIVARIFEPFFTTKPLGTAAGLGLSLCYSIVLHHKGRIYYQARAAGGASFTVELPLAPDASSAPASENVTTPNFRSKEPLPQRANFLVVDDEPTLGALLKDMLEMLGHNVVVRGSPQDALAALYSENFDIVISDFRMPGMTGGELYRRAIQHDERYAARFIFLTGDMVNEETRTFFENGNVTCILKPFQLATIEKAVEQTLAKQREELAAA